TPSESDTGSDGSAQSWAWCLTPAGCLTPLESDTGSAQSWGWCLTPAGCLTPPESDTGSAQSWAWCLTPAGCLTPSESDTGSAQSWGVVSDSRRVSDTSGVRHRVCRLRRGSRRWSGLLYLDACAVDHAGPLRDFGIDQLLELFRRACHDFYTLLAETLDDVFFFKHVGHARV